MCPNGRGGNVVCLVDPGGVAREEFGVSSLVVKTVPDLVVVLRGRIAPASGVQVEHGPTVLPEIGAYPGRLNPRDPVEESDGDGPSQGRLHDVRRSRWIENRVAWSGHSVGNGDCAIGAGGCAVLAGNRAVGSGDRAVGVGLGTVVADEVHQILPD